MGRGGMGDADGVWDWPGGGGWWWYDVKADNGAKCLSYRHTAPVAQGATLV